MFVNITVDVIRRAIKYWEAVKPAVEDRSSLLHKNSFSLKAQNFNIFQQILKIVFFGVKDSLCLFAFISSCSFFFACQISKSELTSWVLRLMS